MKVYASIGVSKLARGRGVSYIHQSVGEEEEVEGEGVYLRKGKRGGCHVSGKGTESP